MSERKLSGAQRRKRQIVAIDNEAKKSSHIMERFIKKAKRDDEPQHYSVETVEYDDDDTQHEPKALDKCKDVLDQIQTETFEPVLQYEDHKLQRQDDNAERNQGIDGAVGSNARQNKKRW